jgi:hypothetical protein
MPCRAAPASMVDAVRARIAPLFPDWAHAEIEALVCQIAAVEWRYSVGGTTSEARPASGGDSRRSE